MTHIVVLKASCIHKIPPYSGVLLFTETKESGSPTWVPNKRGYSLWVLAVLESEVGVRMPMRVARVAECWEEGKRIVLRECLVSHEGNLL